jgi:hypothetical protein
MGTANVAIPVAATSVAGLTGTPLEAAAALIGAAMAFGPLLRASPSRMSAVPPARPLARQSRDRYAHHPGSGSLTSQGTGSPPPWCPCWLGARSTYHSPRASLARWGRSL